MTTARQAALAAILAWGISGTPVTALAADPAVAPAPGQTYTVQKGDTLWDIAGESVFDPFMWPRVWDSNRGIENPHLLTPGQQLTVPALRVAGQPVDAAPPGPGSLSTPVATAPVVTEAAAPPSLPAPPAFPPPPPAPLAAEPAALQAERKPGIRFIPEAEKQELIAVLATYGFIAERGETGLGTVTSVESGHRMLNLGDIAEIALPPGGSLATGRTYSLARTVREVEHPLTGKTVGNLVRMLGELKVTSVEGNRAKGEVVALHGSSEVGDTLMEKVDYLSWIPGEGAAAPAGVSGTVLANPDGATIMGKGAILFLDLGTRDGMGPGTRLEVWDDRKGRAETARSLEERKPSAILGEIVIVAPRERTSVARVTSSQREIHPGAKAGAPR